MAFAQVDAGYNGLVSENIFKEVIAQRDELTRIDGGRMVPGANELIYNAGLILAQYTSGPNTGLWAPYLAANSGASDGSQIPAGVLYAGCDVMPNGYGSEIRVITGGVVFADLCLTLDANGNQVAGAPAAVITAMGGKKKIVHGQNLLKF